MSRQQWNPCNSAALLPSFRRAIIAFRAQLLPLCRRPGLRQPTAAPPSAIHTHAWGLYQVYDVQRGHDYFPVICFDAHTCCVSLSHCLFSAWVPSMFRLLLVAAVVCCAQSHAVTSQHPQLLQALGDATKALQAAQQSLEEALGQPSPSPALTSVGLVQDWSLVCKELCG